MTANIKRGFCRVLVALICVAVTQVSPRLSHAESVNIANCGPNKGWSYFVHNKYVSKKDSGWVEDGISQGQYTLKLLNGKDLDLLFIDAKAQVRSLKQEGGQIFPMRMSSSEITFLHIASNKVAEIYSFFIEADGTEKYSIIMDKGAGNIVHRKGITIGKCNFIRLPKDLEN